MRRSRLVSAVRTRSFLYLSGFGLHNLSLSVSNGSCYENSSPVNGTRVSWLTLASPHRLLLRFTTGFISTSSHHAFLDSPKLSLPFEPIRSRDDLQILSSPYFPAYAQGQGPPPMVEERFQSIISQLFQYRIIRCGGAVDDDMANIIMAAFYHLFSFHRFYFPSHHHHHHLSLTIHSPSSSKDLKSVNESLPSTTYKDKQSFNIPATHQAAIHQNWWLD